MVIWPTVTLIDLVLFTFRFTEVFLLLAFCLPVLLQGDSDQRLSGQKCDGSYDHLGRDLGDSSSGI